MKFWILAGPWKGNTMLVMRWRGYPLVVVAALVLAMGCTSADDTVDRAKCERLRDHLIDLRIADAQHLPTLETPAPIAVPASYRQPGPGGRAMPPVVTPPERVNTTIDLAQHRAALKQAMGDSFIGACTADMSIAQVRCLLDAKDRAGASSCPKSSAHTSFQQTASK